MYETKGDIINQAYSKLRISGKTKIPDASDIELAIGELELIANEIESRNLCTGFNFEEEPDPARGQRPQHPLPACHLMIV